MVRCYPVDGSEPFDVALTSFPNGDANSVASYMSGGSVKQILDLRGGRARYVDCRIESWVECLERVTADLSHMQSDRDFLRVRLDEVCLDRDRAYAAIKPRKAKP